MPVEVKGVKATLKAIRKVDPELLKNMNKQIKAVMIPIRDKARGYAPSPQPDNLYGWTENTVGQKITAETTSRKGYRSNNPGAGEHFVSRMGPLYGATREERGRMIFRAWHEDQGKAQGAVIKAIEATINAFNRGSYTKAA
jgi:hypothetical protein